MQAGSVIGKAWDTYTAHWRHLIPIAFVVYVAISLITVLLAWLLGWVGIVLGWLVGLAGLFWLQGALVLAIDDVRDGRADLSIGQTLERVQPRLGTLALAGLIAAVAVGVGLVLFIVPGLYLLTIWLLIVPAIMLENCGVGESFGRSRELVRGYGWSVFGVIALTFLILIGVDLVLSIVRSGFDSEWAGLVFNIIAESLTAPFLALAWTITYFELRALKGAEPAAAV
ncbi:MAG TPA: hypothetical protein VH281_05320 [Gaiellaceae bacterium]